MSGTVEWFLCILAASFFFSVVLSHIPLLRVPTAIGYLLFGVILQAGPMPLPTGSMHLLSTLGAIGLYVLMFISGLEIDVTRAHVLADSGIPLLRVALFMFCATLLLSFSASWVLVHAASVRANPWMITLLFATSSLGVIVPVLEEAGVLHSAYGQVLLQSALVADLVTMLLLSLFISRQTAGSITSFLLTLSILPLGASVYGIFRFIRRRPALRRWAGDDQTRARAALVLLALFCVTAQFTGAEPIVGSFLAGMLISATTFAAKPQVLTYCRGIGYGFLIPIFFLSVGMNFDLGVFAHDEAILWIPACLLLSYLVKMLPAWHLKKYFGRRKAIAAGFAMSTRLSLVVAAADIGVRVGALPPEMASAVVMVAVITCLISPVAFLTLVSRPSSARC